jgi:ATP-dependent helicase/nuclease subunit A
LPNLPDTLLWTEREGLTLWCPRADLAVPFYTGEKRALRERNLEEYRRLLYVALSRAQDRLYICGWQTREAPREDSWHALCRTGLAEISTPFAFDATALIGADGWCGHGSGAPGGSRSRGRTIAGLGASPAASRARSTAAARTLTAERGRAARSLAARGERA